jgi:DNA-binding GntR family transcriptional regulator
MSKPQPVERLSLAGQVANALRELILSGAYVQDQPLRQDEIASRLGVSRIPVREALQLLEAEGLILNVPYKGAVVARLSAAEIEEYFDIRANLECDLLERAIPNMTPEHIEAARKAEKRIRTNAAAQWGEHNWRLHVELYLPANRPITLDFAKKIHDNLDRYVRLQLALSKQNRVRAHKEHTQLIDLCESGTRRDAVKLLRDHIMGARNDLLSYIKEHHG